MKKPVRKVDEKECFNCQATCTERDFCHGCAVFVCGTCSVNPSLARGHEPNDHLTPQED